MRSEIAIALLAFLGALPLLQAQEAFFESNFESGSPLPEGWSARGHVLLDTQGPFQGKASLCLQREEAAVDQPATLTGPVWNVQSGAWDMAFAVKSRLTSPDSSYNGEVALELLDVAGKVAHSIPLVDLFGSHPWQLVRQRVDIPAGIASARFQVRINKAVGQFWIDALAAKYAGPGEHKASPIKRAMLYTARLGNLFYPDDDRKVCLEVRTSRQLADDQLSGIVQVRDYWGAEQVEPVGLSLNFKGPAKADEQFRYEAAIDLSKVPLEIGRYYEVEVSLPQKDAAPVLARTTLAILPEAEAKRYHPEEVPFTSRSWNNTFPETVLLTDRLGIRIAGIWGGWKAEPPYEAFAPCIAEVEKLKLGFLTGTPVMSIEGRYEGYEKYNETSLREGMRNFLKKYAHIRPLYIDLGNEPHGTGERVTENVNNYRIIYEEVKKFDPTITVIASSMGPEEEYFKAGLGQYCDAYDFHVYEDSKNIRAALRRYQELFKQYGHPHPVWSTEVGLNSHGMSRQAVARELIRKFTSFFAEGGANISWFGLLYPDQDGTITGTSSDAHNVFTGLYGHYSPRLDAIAYYDAVNSIAIKKFLAEKKYGEDISAFLFRDRDNHNLQILWKDKGCEDVFLPLPGAKSVRVIRLDGSHRELDAAGRGITISISEDPVLLLYDGADVPLAESLGGPLVKFTTLPPAITRGATATVAVALVDGMDAKNVNLVGPPLWPVQKKSEGRLVVFEITAPEESSAREADLTVTAGSQAEVYGRIPIIGRLSLRLLPVPAFEGKSAAVRLVISNHGNVAEQVAWSLALTEQLPLVKGQYSAAEPVSAYFTDSPKGSLTIPPGESAEVSVPLSNLDPLTLYRLRAQVTDAKDRTISQGRLMGGFVAVPRLKKTLKLDGNLDDSAWRSAPVQAINEARQFFPVLPTALPWKGPEDLSGTLQFLWDDQFLYMGVRVTDDIAGHALADNQLWAQDGLQFLVDPSRESAEKVGKYDYSVGIGQNGPAAWCDLSADSAAPVGQVTDMRITAQKGSGGSVTYEIAIPWSRVAPFKPAPGADLGLTLILNDDDGSGRNRFMTWFGNAHTKQVDTAGDLILLP